VVEGGRIGELTPELDALLREVGAKWAAAGGATGPGDRDAAEEGVRTAYRAAGCAPPRFVVWLDSPWAGLVGQSLLPAVIAAVTGGRAARLRARLPRRRRDQLAGLGGFFPGTRELFEAQVTDAVLHQVTELACTPARGGTDWRILAREAVRDQVHAQRELVVWEPDGEFEGYTQAQVMLDPDVRPRVHAELVAQVAAQAGVRATPLKPPRLLPRGWWHAQPLGRWGLAGHAMDDGMEAIGVRGLEPCQGERQTLPEVGWWWAFRDYAVLTRRPDVYHRDAEGRPHCADGPAALWPDGWAVHAWHGVRVPAALIEGAWTTDRILRERNAEVRRCAIERMGWPEFIVAAGLRQVGADEPDPGNPGQHLSLYDVPTRLYNVPVRVLLCTNASVERDGTRRRYGLTVPADTPDPVTAAAGLLGLTRNQYLTIHRAT
jgi:hypothetical protein